jgi:cobalt transport protein
MRMDNKTLYIVGFAIIAIMCVGTLLLVNGEFGGSDDAGGEVVEEYDYEPWTEDWMADLGFELPGETESFLFAVQAAIGAIIIGYFIGMNAASKKD